MWPRIFALALKELLAMLRDPRSRFVVIGPPIIQLLVFGYAATFDLNHVKYAVYAEDHGAAARQLLADFAGSPNFLLARNIDRETDIRELVERRDVLMVVHVGQQFSRDIALGRPAPLQLIIDGRNSNTALVALGYAQEIVNRFNADWTETHGLTGPPAVIQSRAWFNPNLESRWFFVPGLAGLIVLVVTLAVTALSIAREREHGTFDQLLVTPMTPLDILLGKSLPGVLIGIAEGTFIVLVTIFWFNVPLLGSLLAFYVGLLLFLLSAVGMGLMISSLCATLQQALLGTFLFMMPAVILSGFATPIANMPKPVQWLTLADPLRYFLVVVRDVFLEGSSFGVLFHQLWPMAVIGVVSMALASWLFRHRLY
ncbi:MAG TPA: ABC transporter permease [Gammaproteobacteria bacterium]|nr:ABC transporter permease [Gammaproteobacteria bacterium]